MSLAAKSNRSGGLASGLRFLGRVVGSRYNPLLAQVVVTRRCNLACGYCSEYDDHSAPVPLPTLLAWVDHLASLKTAAITFTGGEPLLHPELDQAIRAARGHGMIVTMITNGFRLTKSWIERLNAAGLQGMQISIDNLRPDAVSMKSLSSVEGKLALLSQHARFKVNVNSVLGVSRERTQDVVTVANTAAKYGLQHSVGVLARRSRHAGAAERRPDERVPAGDENIALVCARAELLAVSTQFNARPPQRLEMPRRRTVFIRRRGWARALVFAAARLSRHSAVAIWRRGPQARVSCGESVQPDMHVELRASDEHVRPLSWRATGAGGGGVGRKSVATSAIAGA